MYNSFRNCKKSVGVGGGSFWDRCGSVANNLVGIIQSWLGHEPWA